jgi:hypothetical protein
LKIYGDDRVAVKDLRYREYKTPGEHIRKVNGLEKIGERKVDSISRHLAAQPYIFLMEYNGRIEFPKTGAYLFKLQTGGGGVLVVNGDTVIKHDGANNFEQEINGLFKARAQSLPFTLTYNKPIQYRHGLALFVEGPGVAMHALHAPGSVFHEPAVEPLIITPPNGKARIQRSFMDSGQGRKTHCLSVGTPEGIHFTVDLERGNLLQIWDGRFLDVTSMWHRRGNLQMAIPLGARIRFPDAPALTTSAGGLRFAEYQLDAQGMPEFRYTSGNLNLFDKLTPSANERSISRKIRITGTGEFHYALVAGEIIEQLADGSFLVNDKEYYMIVNAKGMKLGIEKSGELKAVVLQGTAAGELAFEYMMLW